MARARIAKRLGRIHVPTLVASKRHQLHLPVTPTGAKRKHRISGRANPTCNHKSAFYNIYIYIYIYMLHHSVLNKLVPG